MKRDNREIETRTERLSGRRIQTEAKRDRQSQTDRIAESPWVK